MAVHENLGVWQMAGTISELRTRLCVVSALIGSAIRQAADLEAREGVERLQCLLDEAENHAEDALAIADRLDASIASSSSAA